MPTDSEYYQHAGSISLARRVGNYVRRRIYTEFLEAMQPQPFETILDVGVASERPLEENFFERNYPHPELITCAGIDDGVEVRHAFPQVKYVRIQRYQPLPFKDREFPVAFSNAVLEHAGSRERQRFFLAEIARVSERMFVSFPNRWFPLEHHTGMPLLHYLPRPTFRKLLRGTRFNFWADEENLNIISLNEAMRLLPTGHEFILKNIGIGVGLFRSNVVIASLPHNSLISKR